MKKSGIVLVVDDLGRILAVSNRRYGGWCLPGGKVDPGETPRKAAVRELREETSLRASEKDLVFLAKGESATETGREVSMFFARLVRGYPRQVERGTEVTWMHLPALRKSKPFGRFYREHLADGILHLRSTAFANDR